MRFLFCLLFLWSALAGADCRCLPDAATLDAAPAAAGMAPAQQPLRQYALFAYRNIAHAAIMGEGPYLQTLQDLFAAACNEPAPFNAWLRQLLLDAPQTTDFARRLSAGHHLASSCAGAAVSALPVAQAE